MGSPLSRWLFVAYFLEVGLVLTFVPWSTYWDRNLLSEVIPTLRVVLQNNYVRGGVSGIGLINLIAAFDEIMTVIANTRLNNAPNKSVAVSVLEDPVEVIEPRSNES
ncbi:MAG: hypothetical protein CL487_01140 [Acidobacteria bacterium]|uniref:Uncharacterized protein n=1 Tax=marine metagenome TaxID=408172 RepID=A0A381NI84_9ZZZZ|nr:hypothetical protein [Acidobacteriota bacterium]|tara:strand:- start:4722 stop:5042 length:321 start_codon:yes stop_codon:yes gene_type:complete